MAIVLAVPDLTALQRRLSEQGASVFGPIEIRRQWTLPTGETLDVALDILIGGDNSLPFKWAAVRHHTVEHYQRSEFTLHANGLMGLRAIAISVDDPRAAAMGMEAMFGCKHHWCREAAIVALGNAHLLLLADGSRRLSGTRDKCPIVGAILHGEFDERNIDNVMCHFLSKMQIDDCLGVKEIGHLEIFTVEDSLI